VVVQGLEFSFLDDEEHAALRRTLATVFPEVHSYAVPIPSFLSAWGFLIASDWLRPEEWSSAAIDGAIHRKLGDWLDHIDGDFMKSRFSLCKETKALLA